MSTAIFNNRATGQTLKIDTARLRLVRMRHRINAWAAAMDDVILSPAVQMWAVMLTYRPGETWNPNDIKETIRHIRRFYGDYLLGHAWVAELQARGVIHYHLCLALDSRAPMRHADRAGWWRHGYTGTRRLKAFNPHYLTKYLQKNAQKGGNFPCGARLFGVSVNTPISDESYFQFRLSAIPLYVSRAVQTLATNIKTTCWTLAKNAWHWEPLPGGGWLLSFRKYYQVVQSVWAFIGIEGDVGKPLDKRWGTDP